MTIGAVSGQVMFQAAFLEDDQVIQALASDASDQALDIRPLRTGMRQDCSIAIAFTCLRTEGRRCVAITQQILGCALARKGYPELVSSRLANRIGCQRKVNDAPTLMR